MMCPDTLYAALIIFLCDLQAEIVAIAIGAFFHFFFMKKMLYVRPSNISGAE